MSMLYSIARIVHPTERIRRIITAVAVLFLLLFLAFIAMKLWWLTQNLSWLKETQFYTKPGRPLPTWMYIYQLCCEYARCLPGVKLKTYLADCITDLILISLAVRSLWSMNLPKKQRTMIIAIFSSTIIVTMASIFRGVSQIMSLRSLMGVAPDFEV